MIKIHDKSECCGCWACASACPKHCITMVEDDEGFRYPQVNEDACINCGLCEKVCPEKKDVLGDVFLQNYTIQNKDVNVRRKSTSGGFFSVISKWAIDQGGVVFGVSFDECMTLRHMYSETIEGCSKFRGSKYAQSLIGDSFEKVKCFLKEGRVVVFSGTPCQIAGLYCFLGQKTFENLVTVDVVCHGVPSPRLLKKYLDYHSTQFDNSKPVNYLSRDKYYSYSYSTASIFFENGKSYHRGKDSDLMLGLYFRDLISRPSCYQCHFKTIERVSDITIFDCWNAPDVSPVLDRDGATNVIIHTQKGMDVFDFIKQDFVYAHGDFKKILERDGVMLKNRVSPNPRRAMFFEDLNKDMSIPQIENKYFHRSLVKKVLSFVKPFMFRIGLFDLYLRLKK